MAQATLNPAINGLDNTSTLYDLYTRFYDGMTKANSTDAPDFVADPIYEKNEDGTDKLDADGAKIVDTEAMSKQMEEYSSILIKNSAYMMANAIIATIDPDGGSSGGTAGKGFVSRSGDTMQGSLGALYGFEAGYNNTKIFETVIDSSDKKLAIVAGNLQVSEGATVNGKLNLSDSGIFFGGNQVISQNQGTLNLSSQNIGLNGEVSIDGSLKIGDVSISKNGLSYGIYDYYHSGNSNMKTVDWTMYNAFVNGDLSVGRDTKLTGLLSSVGGFAFSVDKHDLLYSVAQENATPYMVMNSDLSIINDHGIKFNDNYIIWVKDTDNVVSFSAPGAVMNLGDKGENTEGAEVITKHIALQTDIKNYNGAYTIVSSDGSGNFPNGFSTGAANSLGATFQTYVEGDDYGVVSKKNMRFGATTGPSLSSDGTKLDACIPFSYVLADINRYSSVNLSLYGENSSSLVLNPTSDSSKFAFCFGTDATHFTFGAPIEASEFVVKSSKYKTRLEEDALFFDDGVFIEGITDGMRLSKNSMFDGNLYSFDSEQSSVSFSSGFAGSGWAILEDKTSGGVHATFDSLTIRKKMRVYELEAQRSASTNGSLWVSDSCSGDEVRELN